MGALDLGVEGAAEAPDCAEQRRLMALWGGVGDIIEILGVKEGNRDWDGIILDSEEERDVDDVRLRKCRWQPREVSNEGLGVDMSRGSSRGCGFDGGVPR